MRFKDIALTSGGLLFQQAAQFIVGIYVARQLGASEYGTISLARNIISLLVTITPLGLDLALLKYLPQSSHTDDEHRSNVLPFLRIVTGVNLAVTALLILVSSRLEHSVYHYHNFALYFSLTALSLPFLSLIAVYGAFYRAIGKPGTFAVIGSFVQTALRSTFNLVAVTVGLGAAGVAAGTSLAAALALIYAWYTVRAGVEKKALHPRPARGEVRRVLHEAKWMAASLFVGGLARSADIMVLALFAAAPIVGSYGALSMIAYVVTIYPIALSQTMGPEIARYYNNGELDQITRVQSRYIANATVISGFIFAGIGAFGQRLTLILGDSFTISPALAIMLPLAYLVTATLSPMGFALSMTGQHRRELAILVGGSGLMVALLFLLVPLYGAIGAAAAVFLASTFNNVTRFVLVARHIGATPGRLRDVLPPMAGLALAFGARGTADIVLGPNLAGSVAGCLLYTVCFALLFWCVLLNSAGREGFLHKIRRSR